MKRAGLVLLAACGAASPDVVVELHGQAEVEVIRHVDAPAHLTITGGAGHLVEAWVSGGATLIAPSSELADAWFPPTPTSGDRELDIAGQGAVELHVWARGDVVPRVARERSLAWFSGDVLDANLSFARVMTVVGGGAMLERWFTAFAAGPGAGRATFAQFLDEVRAAQGPDPAHWDLTKLPFKITGVHNRVDLASDAACGELRVSAASTHPTFAPVHLIFLFEQAPRADDVTPDGVVHCRGTARRWARLTALDPAGFASAAAALLDDGLVPDRFLLAESVELTISPWQWRQWNLGATAANPPLFQTIDVARVATPGALRDAFLAAVAANRDAILARRWTVPAMFRSPVAEVQPTSKAPLPDVPAELQRPLAMIGCPRCHTDDADFIQTTVDRTPSPFYDKELAARADRLEALGRGETPPPPPFGPLQSP